MLTKAHLQYSIKQGKIVPKLIGSKRVEELFLAKKMIAVYKNAANSTVAELNDAFKIQGFERYPLFAAFKELLDDRLVASEKNQEEIEQTRWGFFCAAQKMREEQYFQTKEAFQQTFAETMGKQVSDIQKELYQDLP